MLYYSTLCKFAENLKPLFKSTKLRTKVLEERLDLRSQHVFRDLAQAIETNLVFRDNFCSLVTRKETRDLPKGVHSLEVTVESVDAFLLIVEFVFF